MFGNGAAERVLTAHKVQRVWPGGRPARGDTEENLENRYWDFGGSTVVSTNKYIRLTPDRQSKTGWLWSKTVRPEGA